MSIEAHLEILDAVNFDRDMCIHGYLGRCPDCERAALLMGVTGLRLTREVVDALQGKVRR